MHVASCRWGSVSSTILASHRRLTSDLWRCWRARLVCAAVLASALSALPRGLGAQGADWSRYQPAQLRDVAEDLPGQPGVSITGDVPVRSRVAFVGEFRDLPENSRRLIRAWSDSMDVRGMLEVFRREVRVRQGDREYWLPAQEPLARAMDTELHAGEMIEVLVIYIGRVDGRPVFLVNAFDHAGDDHQHRRGLEEKR